MNHSRFLPFIAGTLTFSVSLSGMAETVRHFNQPAQPLGKALTEFADQTGTKLLFPAQLVEGLTAPALRGHYTDTEALQHLLAEAPLTYTKDGIGGTLTLVRAEKPVPAYDEETVQLSPITVNDEALTEEEELRTAYTVKRTLSATKTDTPIMDTPVSVQAVPRAVMDDQKTPELKEALENVSSVRPQPSLGVFNGFIIRGFHDFNQYRNGLRVGFTSYDTANLQSLEVLKGPAGVLSAASSRVA
ncbi:STN domain-containing protein [Methylocaldum szegediense]|uniref:Secretin/TonB short N-terminal domain-containing protein n=1 Tax=Methylocaldum szegediense TaxID=73780 RepID=A0ABM9I156_9GAMM|nr:STN domain-containing protein [Methylocaldum szegediense]CAI8820298.1 protein of unknown function [Methylocaldum szegediense]